MVCSFTQGTDLIRGSAGSKPTLYIQTLLLESGDRNKSTKEQRKIIFFCTTNKKINMLKEQIHKSQNMFCPYVSIFGCNGWAVQAKFLYTPESLAQEGISKM